MPGDGRVRIQTDTKNKKNGLETARFCCLLSNVSEHKDEMTDASDHYKYMKKLMGTEVNIFAAKDFEF